VAVNLSRKIVVFSKTDTVSGTPESGSPSVSTDAMLLFNEYNPVQVDTKIVELTPIRGSFTKNKQLVGRTLHMFKPVTVVMGSGTAGTRPFLSPFLRACGLNEQSGAAAGSSYVAYTPISEGIRSATAWVYAHDILHKVGSYVGTGVFDGKAGEGMMFNGDFKGLYTSVGSVTQPTGITYPTDRKTQIESEAFTIAGLGAGVAIVQSVRFDLGVQVTERPDYSSPKGLKGLLVIDRKPTVNAVWEMENDLSTHDWWDDIQAANDIDASWQHGSTPGNIVVFTTNDMQMIKGVYQDAGGIRTMAADFNCQNAVDNAEYEIRFK
jgi:hypothetical protein